MEIVRNNIIPFKGYKCVNLFGILFVRSDAVMTSTDINHESIHTAQMKEMLYVSFYLWYVIEWLVRLVQYRNAHTAYRNISFEQEANAGEDDETYLENSGYFEWIKFIRKAK